MATIVDRLTERVMQRMIAALATDEACRCAACNGEGYVVVDGGPTEAPCTVCGGTGIDERSAGDGA